jgi:hypothetical protein
VSPSEVPFFNDNMGSVSGDESKTESKFVPTIQENFITIRLPEFNVRNPRVWFHQVEAIFAARRITSQTTRFSYVVEHLPSNIAVEVVDILKEVPETTPYDAIRTAIIARACQSDSKMLRELFNSIELGDRTPSQLLRYMRSLLNGRKLDEDIMKHLWLDKLPTSISQFLSVFLEDDSLDRLAQKADKIYETCPTRILQPVTHFSQTDQVSSADPVLNAVTELTTRFDSLDQRLSAIELDTHRSRHSRTRTQNSWCWYHQTFGPKARKCEQPCTFSKKPRSQSNFSASR